MIKKLLFIFFFACCFSGVTAQTTYWNLSGNTNASISSFIGTSNCIPVIFKTRNVERMRLMNDKSFLGIGLSNPQATLHLHYQVDSRACGALADGRLEDASLLITNKLLQLTTSTTGFSSNNGFSIYANDSKEVIFKQQEQANFSLEGPGGGLIIAPNGRVGIGTSAPHTTLDVIGDISVKNLWVNHVATTDWTYAAGIYVNRPYTKAIVVSNSGTETFVVSGNGVVSTKKIFTEKLEITMSAMNSYWYDHVFYPEYKLRPLPELEQFIKENHHLPEIPSAEEVKQKGIDVGDIQGKLLLKIEELTLYILDLQKQIDALREQKGAE